MLSVVVVDLRVILFIHGLMLRGKLFVFAIFKEAKELQNLLLEIVSAVDGESNRLLESEEFPTIGTDCFLDKDHNWIVIPKRLGEPFLAKILRDEYLVALFNLLDKLLLLEFYPLKHCS